MAYWWPRFLESRLNYPPISSWSAVKFLISRITNPGIKRHSWKQSYSSFNYPSVKLITNRLNELPAYKSAGKRQSGRKKSTPILVLPIDTCCSLLSIFDSNDLPFVWLWKNKTSNLSSKKNKVEIMVQCKVMLIRAIKSVSSLPLDSLSHRDYFELYKARRVSRKNVYNKVLICAE